MKILHVIPNLETGGAQKLIESLLPRLMPECDLKLIVFHKTESAIEEVLEKSGLLIHDMSISDRSPKAIFKLRKYFKWADIVHLHLFPTHYFSVLTNFGLSKPLIFTEHSTHNKRRNIRIFSFIENIVYGKLSKIVCVSEGVKNCLTDWIGKNRYEINSYVIENGIDINKYKSVEKKTAKEIFGREGKPILMIGRFTSSKDHECLIRALNYIEYEDSFIALVGEGGRKHEIENIVKSEGFEKRVMFLGERNDIPDIIAASAIGVMSSHWEGFGISAIEMMAGGLPVIASDIDGLNEIVEGAGILFQEGNEKDLADKINLLATDDGLYHSIEKKGRIRAEKYSIEITAKKHLELYKSILDH